MKHYWLCFVLFCVIQLNGQTTINTLLKDFSELKVYSGIDIKLISSDEHKVVISGEKANKVKLKYEGSTLKILLRFPETLAEGKATIALYFNKPIITIDANEGAMITSDVLSQESLELRAQEGAYINVVVDTKMLKIKGSSSGVFEVSGSTDNQDIYLDLGANYHGYKVDVKQLCQLNVGSGAKAEVTSGHILEAKVNFGGTILYKGTPNVLTTKKVIGGTIEQRD